MIQGNYPEVISGISDNAFEVLVHPKLIRTELEILKRVRIYDKNIADDLHISYHTVTMNKARQLIVDLGLRLEVAHDADMAANRSFEVREVMNY